MKFLSMNLYNIVVILIALLIFILLISLKKMRINGIITCAFFLLVFILGSVLKNLFLLYISGSVLFLFLYILIYYIVILIYYKKKEVKINSINYGTLRPLEKNKITIAAEQLPFIFSGFFFLIEFDLYEVNENIKRLSAPIYDSHGKNYKINIYFDRHGFYTIKNVSLTINDLFGFTRHKLTFAYENKIRVYPFMTDAVKLPLFLDKGGEEIIQSVVKINSKDFYESRKYYPGDDPRRINWKMFAHSGELHVREVEKIPPKIGEIKIIFAPYSDSLVEYEYISSIFIATIQNLLNYELEVKIYSPCNIKPILINKNKENDFNNIIDRSYKKIDLEQNLNLKNVILFASFSEYEKILNNFNIKSSYAFVILYINSLIKRSLSRTILLVNKFENILKELIFKMRMKNKIDKREKGLEKIIEISKKKNIHLEVFRVEDEI